jgi:hypothetical protein
MESENGQMIAELSSLTSSEKKTYLASDSESVLGHGLHVHRLKVAVQYSISGWKLHFGGCE